MLRAVTQLLFPFSLPEDRRHCRLQVLRENTGVDCSRRQRFVPRQFLNVADIAHPPATGAWCRCASACQPTSHTSRARPGVIVVTQTFGEKLNPNSYFYCDPQEAGSAGGVKTGLANLLSRPALVR